MSTRLSQFREYAADAFDAMAAANRATAEILSELPAPASLGRLQFRVLSEILGGISDLIREPDDDELDYGPPFEGGQCDGDCYRISVNFPDNSVERSMRGPIGGVRWVQTSDEGVQPVSGKVEVFGRSELSTTFACPTLQSPQWFEFASGGVFEDNQPTGLTIISNLDGDDDCGDPEPSYPPGGGNTPVGDDGNLPLPGFPDWPSDWIPRVCGIEIGPCPGLAICAGPFRAVVGPCGVDVGLNPDGLEPGEDGAGNVDPSPIGDLDVGVDGDDEISVPDDVESVWIELTSPVPPSVRVTHTSSSPDLVEYWLGFASTGTNTGDGSAYDDGTPLQHGRNYYRLESCLEDRTLKVRSPQGVTWRVTDTGERTGRCGGSSGDTEAS